MWNNIDSYNFQDAHAGLPLEQIPELSERAWSLIARNKDKPLLQEGLFNIGGAVEMLSGMEYHASNIVVGCRALACGGLSNELFLYHEVNAYLNRLGQFYYFTQSDLVKRVLVDPVVTIPIIRKFVVFRHKYAAHRSIDMPRKEDIDSVLWLQARSLAGLGGKILSPRPGAAPLVPIDGSFNLAELRQRIWRDYYFTVQIYDVQQKAHVNLTVEVDHPLIAQEAYALLETVIMHEGARSVTSSSVPTGCPM
jgi:hypothetical protein